MKMERLLLVVMLSVLTVFTVSCAPDPRDVAEGDAIRMRAEQDAADRQAAREQAQQNFESDQAEEQAKIDQWIRSWNSFVSWVMVVATIAVCVMLGGLAVGVSWGVIGLGRAAANYAMLRSNLIPLDRFTRQYPLLTYSGQGRFMLSNPNTQGVIPLDSRNPADRQMISAMGAVQLAGTVAEAARQHKADPTGVASVGTSPVIIGARQDKDGALSVGDLVGSIFGGNDEH